jgi:TrkA domain protein
MDVERTPLPGIGLRHVFTTRRGRRLGVISHRNGRKDLLVYDVDDPDTCSAPVALASEEAETLAGLLEGESRIVERETALDREIEGLTSRKVVVESGSPYDGRTLGETRARRRTGASIVAVVHGGEVIASPGPDFRFQAGDLAVVIGTAEGTVAVAELFTNG